MMQDLMQDPLKVFLGQLHPGIVKPTILGALQAANLAYVDVIVPRAQSCCFVICGGIDEGQRVLDTMHGRVDPMLSPTVVQAARTNIGGLEFVFRGDGGGTFFV